MWLDEEMKFNGSLFYHEEGDITHRCGIRIGMQYHNLQRKILPHNSISNGGK